MRQAAEMRDSRSAESVAQAWRMKALVSILIVVVAIGIGVGGWIGYRATQPKKHCYAVTRDEGMFGVQQELICR